MALLTDEQLHTIRDIIRRHHQAFTVNVIGPEAVPPAVLEELQQAGFIGTEIATIEDAYKYGQALAAGTNPDIATMGLEEFRRWLTKNPIPLTQPERRAIEIAQHRAAEYAVGLGNRVSNQVGERILRADRELATQIRDEIRTQTAENIARRESIGELVSDFKWMSKDWARDWHRIAVTEKQQAMQHGQADHMAKRFGPDTWVSKQPAADACKHCLRLHIGPDGHPRIFRLKDLEANGSNVGRKAMDWRATVGPVHPHCQCILVRVPAGWGYDQDGELVPGGEQGVRYETAEDLELSLLQESDLRKGALQGHVEYQGIPIAIENRKGSTRKWTNEATGEVGETRMLLDYGYVKKTQGADAEEVDCYVGSDPRAGTVYVVHQLDPATGRYDETKCFLGVRSRAAARVAYHAHMNNPAAFGWVEDMTVDQFKRWLGETEPMPGHDLQQKAVAYTVPMSKALGVPEEALLPPPKPKPKPVAPKRMLVEKSGPPVRKAVLVKARPHKYTRRVPKPGGGYRYYYAESAAAREAKAGEEVKLGKRLAKVTEVHPDGSLTIEVGGKSRKLSPDQWHNLMAHHYGRAYMKSAERRAKQTVNAVMRHVPRELLQDLKGETDAERLADLEKRVPEVYAKLRKSFQRAGLSPLAAKRVLSRTLERRGWEPEARAMVIGSVIKHRALGASQLIDASESLAGGRKVELRHVAAVVELRTPGGNPANFPADVKKTAESAESEMAKLSAQLARAGSPVQLAALLTDTLGAESVQKLLTLAQAFPGLQDKAIQDAREILPKVVAKVPHPPTTKGAETTVYVAGEGGKPKALQAQYRLVEAGDLIPSHSSDNFGQRPDYPAGVQERAYHRDKAEQAKVIRNAQQLNPQFVVNTNPDAVNGPPLVTEDGIVLGGNSRVMSMQRVYNQHPDKAEAYRKYLSDHAAEGGFSATDVAAMKNPVLIRTVEIEDKSQKSLQIFVRQMNETFTQGMDPRTMQVAMGRKLTDSALTSLASDMGEDETLNEFLGSAKADRFIKTLFSAGIIDARNSNQYMQKGTNRLNNDGKTLVARILVGRTVNDADTLSNTGTQLLDSVARAVPFMHQATAHGDGYNIGSDLAVAIDAFNGLQQQADSGNLIAGKSRTLDPRMSDSDFGKLFSQQSLFGTPHPVVDNPRAMQLLEVLVRKRGPVQMANIFRDYAKRAAQNPKGQATMFGKVDPKSILTEVVDSAMGRGEEKLAASLTASGTIPAEIGAQTSPAGNRNPGHGTMVNFMEGNVGRHRPETHPAMIGFDPNETNPGEMEMRRQHADEEDYTVPLQRDQANQVPRPVDDAVTNLHVGSGIDSEDIEAQRKFFEDHEIDNRGAKNRVHVEDGVD